MLLLVNIDGDFSFILYVRARIAVKDVVFLQKKEKMCGEIVFFVYFCR